MKIKYFKIICALLAVGIMTACTDDDRLGPTLVSDLEAVELPVLRNTSSTEAKVFTEVNIGEVYDVFSWSEADYDIDVAINYVLQVKRASESDDAFADFAASQTENFVSVSNEMLNDYAVNTLKSVPEQPDTLAFRVKAFVVAPEGQNPSVDVFSSSITRIVVPFVASDCGVYCTMAIIGDATVGGWGQDTDMYLEDPDVSLDQWKIIAYLEGGKNVKFRANDNWGNNPNPNVSSVIGADFAPNGGASGTADMNDGGSYSIGAADGGYYDIRFDASTLSYSFTKITANTYTLMGLVGPGSPAGDWPGAPPNDKPDALLTKVTGLTAGEGDGHVWTGSNMVFTSGEGKIRADQNWSNNWGVSGGNGTNIFPSGLFDGGDNTGFEAGTYDVWFHDVTTQFMYVSDDTEYDEIGLVGTAVDGWPTADLPAPQPDVLLLKDGVNPYLFSGFVELTAGEFKFRANRAWSKSWGKGTEFEEGISNTGDNFVAKAGIYFVTFNTATGEYKFTK